MKRLFMIDGHALVFRAYYALLRRPMINSKGQDVSAVFGFCKSLFDIILKENPTHLLVAFDPAGKNFRHDLYPLYKANREAAPEQVKQAIPILKRILKACAIPVFVKEGVEADDVIGTLAKTAEQAGFDQIFMVTPDKDYGQLVSPHISIFKPSRTSDGWEILGPAEICAKYGIDNPMQVIDILTVWGDASDNIPGVAGIGEVGAKRLIGTYKTVENLLAHLKELTPKNQERFTEAKDRLPLSKNLVTIRTALDIPWKESDLQIKAPSLTKLREIFQDLEFNSFMRVLPLLEERFGCKDAGRAHIPDHRENSALTPIREYREIDSLTGLAVMHAQALHHGSIAFRLLTNGQDVMHASVTGIVLYIPGQDPVCITQPALIAGLKPLLEDTSVAKIGYDIKDSLGILYRLGIEVQGKLWDISLMHYLINPELSHRLNGLCRQYLGYALPDPPASKDIVLDLFGTATSPSSDKDTLLCAIEEARACYLLQHNLFDRLETDKLLDLYLQVEMPLMTLLAQMELCGVKTDIPRLKELGNEWTREAAAIEKRIRELAGEPTLNVSSPKQLGIVLYEKMEIDGGARKKSKSAKAYSTDEETLNALAGDHPIVALILEFRSLKKLVSSYTDSLPSLVFPADGRIHTTFNQTVTATGRLSSKNPNMQNIPIREARGRELRKAFIPAAEDYKILSADYSQIELRLMAHMSGDPDMIAAFTSGKDIHAATAAKIFHCPLDQVTKEQRSRAKVANFGILYGISAFGLSQRLQISRKESAQLIEDYYNHFPKIKTYLDSIVAFAREHGYVETLFHRKRYTPDIQASNATVRALAQRNAINAPIQGTAADLIKIAMVRIWQQMQQLQMRSRMIIQVHDELVFDLWLPEQELLTSIVKEAMEGAASLSVPLTVDIGIGDNWLEAH